MVLAISGLVVAGCISSGPNAAPSSSSTAHATPGETPKTAPAVPSAPPSKAPTTATIVTFEVAGKERFKVELLRAEDIAHARKLLNGEALASIPVGKVVRDDPGVNAPWSWHIDPTTLQFADITTEVCDGLPSFVEADTITSDTYCPWVAKVVALEPAP